MKRREKLLMLSGSLLIMQSLTGCDMQKVDSFFAPDRRVPEGSTVDFSDRHAPLLNPVQGKNGLRRVPSEEGMGNAGLPMRAASAPVSGPVVGSTAAPSAIYPSVMKEPVVPVASTDVPPPPAPVANASAYPSLSSVPQTPSVPSGASIQNNFNSLATEQKTSDAERQALMNDPNATVLTSPQTGQAVTNPATAAAAPQTEQSFMMNPQPQPVQVVEAAPAAATETPAANPQSAAVDNSDPGFISWMHNLFSSDKKHKQAAASAASTMANANDLNAMAQPTMEVRKAPLENAQAEPASAPAGQQPVADAAPMLRDPSVQSYGAPAAAESQATAAYQPAPQATAPAAGATQQKPVDLMTPQQGASANAASAAVMLPPVKVNEATAPAQASAQPAGTSSWMNNEQAAPAPQQPAAHAAANAEPAPSSVAAPVASVSAAPQPAASADGNAQGQTQTQANGSALPDLSQITSERPVTLTPPRDDSSGAYLQDSRYASHQNDSFGNN